MTKQQAFKFGFLTKLAELNITPLEFHRALTKHAGILGDLVDASKALVANIPAYALTAGVGLPIVGGMFTGKMHSMLGQIDAEEEIDRLKRQQLTEEYLSQAQRMKERMERKNWRTTAKPHRRPRPEELTQGEAVYV